MTEDEVEELKQQADAADERATSDARRRRRAAD